MALSPCLGPKQRRNSSFGHFDQGIVKRRNLENLRWRAPFKRAISANMLKTIEATLPSESEPAFKTPGEAIDFSKSIDRTHHHNDMALCIGQIIRARDWRDDSFDLHLDNHKVLQFGCAQNVVDVIIGDDQPNTVVGGPQTQEVVLVRLKGKEIHWKRDELMRAL